MPVEQHHPQLPESRAGSLTLRAAVIGIFCVLGIAIVGSVSAMLRYDLIGTGHLPRCALYPVILIMGLNYALKRFFRKRGLSTTEMLFIYCTILIMTGIPGQQFAEYMYLGLVGPFCYATPENQYGSAEHGFTKYISDWLVPSKDPNHPVIRWMFEGVRPGAGFTAFLLLMRRQFLWWPFHPLGYVANTTLMFWRYWFSIFVGWLMKVTVTWLGGVKLYRRVYPFAIGLIVGETVILFTWLLFDFIYPIDGVLIIE